MNKRSEVVAQLDQNGRDYDYLTGVKSVLIDVITHAGHANVESGYVAKVQDLLNETNSRIEARKPTASGKKVKIEVRHDS